MPAIGKHVVETHEFDLDGVWLSIAGCDCPALRLLRRRAWHRCDQRRCDWPIHAPERGFGNRIFDETLRIPAPLLAQKEVVLTACAPRSCSVASPRSTLARSPSAVSYSIRRSGQRNPPRLLSDFGLAFCERPEHCSCAEATLGGYSTQRS